MTIQHQTLIGPRRADILATEFPHFDSGTTTKKEQDEIVCIRGRFLWRDLFSVVALPTAQHCPRPHRDEDLVEVGLRVSPRRIRWQLPRYSFKPYH